jgi:hypothetical protein
MQKQKLSDYEAAVSAAMQRHYGISWNDASGELAPLQTALEEGVEPEEFVLRFGERYDLEPVQTRW